MLTKDLLRYHRSYQRIKPSFIDTTNKDFLNFSFHLLSLYRKGITREQLEKKVSVLINSFFDIKLAKGLNKLCLDCSKFTPCQDSSKKRAEVFHQTFFQLNKFDSYQKFYKSLTDKFGEGLKLYDDLPAYDILEERKISRPEVLLARYNVSLVCSLLLYSTRIILELPFGATTQLRNLFKYMRFYRLLFRIKKEKKKYIIEIDGTFSVLEQTKKYGLQLASFFPAILHLPNWKCSAFIKLNQELELKLSNKLCLVSHYHHFSNYIPEEIILFKRGFAQKEKKWRVEKQIQLFQEKQQVLIPDFSFLHKESKKVVHLELFHRWHKFGLLEYLKAPKKEDYIIGVDRSLIKEKKLEKQILEREDCFLYRDFPSFQKVSKFLNKMVK